MVTRSTSGSFQCQYHSMAQRWTLFLKSHVFGIIRKLEANQYIFPYTFNQTSAMTCKLFSQSLFLMSLSLHWKIELYAWSGAMLLTASRPTLTIVVIQSDCSICQVFSSAYFLYILFLPIFFTSFSTFVYSLLSDHLCWLLIGYSLLDALFLIWLFCCMVVLRVSVFYIANRL